jgi:lipoprotein-anchoring transpeptidase ErfK/SrfK
MSTALRGPLLALTVAGLMAAPAAAQAVSAAATARIAPLQQVATLKQGQAARARPDSAADPVAHVRATRPITRVATVLPVIGKSTDKRGTLWLKVRLPGRVIGSAAPPASGWIKAAQTKLSESPWHIVVQVRARRILVYSGGRRVRTYSAIVGKASTPTPRGEYFVEENIRMPASAAGAPFALATSARSSVLQEFEGGPGQIALHGRGNIGGGMGTAVSHGCIRMTDRSITWLAKRIAPGVPVTIS